MSEFKFNATEVSLQTPVQVDDSALRPSRTVEPRSDVDGTPRDPSTGELMDPLALDEFAIEAQSATGTPRTDMCQILNLIEPPRWVAGRHYWQNHPTGWLDSRTDTVLTFDVARAMIAARIEELGLSPVKVMAFPDRHFYFQKDWAAFQALSFESRMAQFKAKAS